MTHRLVINPTQFLSFWPEKWDPRIDRDCQKRGLSMKNVENQQTGESGQKTVPPSVTSACPIKGLFIVHKKLPDN